MREVSRTGWWLLLAGIMGGCGGPADRLQRALDKGTGVVTLPAGTIEIRRELRIKPSSHDLEVLGSPGTLLRAAPDFQGRALLSIDNGMRVTLRGFAIDGNRAKLTQPLEMPSAAIPFANHFQNNGILVESGGDIRISRLQIREVHGFAILAAGVKKISIDQVRVENSGGSNRHGRNNTSGGILLEEGTEDFQVISSVFRNILGNAVWTHSTYRSPRNNRGVIAHNEFQFVGRDAIQVGHANQVRVENNRGQRIGYPVDVVDVENQGTPVAIDTAGKVDESVYTKNRFEEINGKCIDLDGFHDGVVTENACVNRGAAGDYPHGHYALVMNNSNRDMQSQAIVVRDNVFDGTKFGGIFAIGEGHKIIGNRLLNLNRWHCNEGLKDAPCPTQPGDPDLMQAGIYLGERAERFAPARNILVENNEIGGYKMSSRCVMSAPRVNMKENSVRGNRCSDQ
jgi:hypothetical protein